MQDSERAREGEWKYCVVARKRERWSEGASEEERETEIKREIWSEGASEEERETEIKSYIFKLERVISILSRTIEIAR